MTTKECKCGEHTQGYFATPLEAMNSPREKIMYVTCIQPRPEKEGQKNVKCDYLATIDVNPDSPNFCKIMHRLYMPEPGDELHHFGWNACVSCKTRSRKYLVLPGFFSGNIHIIDATTNPLKPSLFKFIRGSDVKEKFGVTFPHTVHCIPNGDVLINTMGDRNGDSKGNFYVLDGHTFQPKQLWNKGNELAVKGHHDFWYQPHHNILISTELGAPKKLMKSFNPHDLGKGYYGSKIHLWKWNEREFLQSIDLGEDSVPFELRFLHNPEASDCYVTTALRASVIHVSKCPNGKWVAKAVVNIPHKMVKNWALPFVPALMTDLIISLDDKFLFISCYLHGDIRQYDISDRSQPKMISQVFVGGITLTDTAIEVEKDEELSSQPDRLIIKGRPIYGGPHMMQLSRDGLRLYVTTSVVNSWDRYFYPDVVRKGGVMLLLDVSSSGMEVNPDFLVDFGQEPDGPVRGHEMRYPFGDCTSDIWV